MEAYNPVLSIIHDRQGDCNSSHHMFYQKGGLTLSVDNNGDVKMAGHGRVNIDTDAHIEVAKDASIVVNGQAEIVGRGHVKFAAADISLQSTQGSIVLNAARDIEIRADKGRIFQHSSGVNQLTTDSGDFHVEVAGDIVAKATNINRIAQKDITESAQGNIIESAQSDITSDCGGTNTISGATIVTASDEGTNLEKGGPSAPPMTITPIGRKKTSAPTS